MSIVSPLSRGSPAADDRPMGTVTALAVLLLFLVVGALQGGVAMVVDPETPQGMSPEYLDDRLIGAFLER